MNVQESGSWRVLGVVPGVPGVVVGVERAESDTRDRRLGRNPCGRVTVGLGGKE